MPEWIALNKISELAALTKEGQQLLKMKAEAAETLLAVQKMIESVFTSHLLFLFSLFQNTVSFLSRPGGSIQKPCCVLPPQPLKKLKKLFVSVSEAGSEGDTIITAEMHAAAASCFVALLKAHAVSAYSSSL